MNSTNLPNCANCKAIIPYEYFLKKFDSKLIFGTYKQIRSDILFNIETGFSRQTIIDLMNLKNSERKNREQWLELSLLNKKISKVQSLIDDEKESYNINISLIESYNAKIGIYKTRIEEIKVEQMTLHRERYNIREEQILNKEPKKNSYIYPCPHSECRGFLNESFFCGLCNSNVCERCYIIISCDETHTCDKNNIDSFNAIKNDSKACPSCGEFISKVSGCDQMFCTTCGTAFSWKTGLIEKGVIHNPHAYDFFERNPELLRIYEQQNAHNGLVGNRNNCQNIPNFTDVNKYKFVSEEIFDYLKNIHRNISTFYIEERQKYLDILNQNEIDANRNIEARKKYIEGKYTKEQFKSYLHRSDKLLNFSKQLAQILLSSYEIGLNILWNMLRIDFRIVNSRLFEQLYHGMYMVNNNISPEILKLIDENINFLKDTSNKTNKYIMQLCIDFQYTSTKFNFSDTFLLLKQTKKRKVEEIEQIDEI